MSHAFIASVLICLIAVVCSLVRGSPAIAGQDAASRSGAATASSGGAPGGTGHVPAVRRRRSRPAGARGLRR